MITELCEGRSYDLRRRRVEHGVLARMKRHAHSEGGDAPAEGRELRRVDLPPSNRIHGMRRERNEVAGNPVQQDLVPFEEREDTIERVQVRLDQFPKAQRCRVAEATRP